MQYMFVTVSVLTRRTFQPPIAGWGSSGLSLRGGGRGGSQTPPRLPLTCEPEWSVEKVLGNMSSLTTGTEEAKCGSPWLEVLCWSP